MLDELAEAEGGSLQERVGALRRATREDARARALAKREATLKEMGLAQAKEGIAVPGMEELEEEELACVVCQEVFHALSLFVCLKLRL